MSLLSLLTKNKVTPLVTLSLGAKDSHKNILLIDKSVKDYKVFVDSVNSNTLPIVYSVGSSKAELLTLLQNNFTTISRIGVVFVSSEALPKMFLDYKPLFSKDEASPYSENVSWLVSVLKEFSVKNIDFLACNSLNFPNWVNYFGVLSSNTSVVVGASNDKTGNIKHGGDWVMESTKEDVELIYFTKSIGYYTYLLDDPINVFGYPCLGVGVYDGNIYATNIPFNFFNDGYNSTGNISKYDIETGFDINYTWANVLNNPIAMTIDATNNFMYVTTTPNIAGSFLSNEFSGNISKINLLTGAVVNDKWVTNISPSFGMVNDGTFLYVSNTTDPNGNISKINLSDGTVVKKNWATGIDGPTALAINGNYMYAANIGIIDELSTGSIQKIYLSNGTIETINWVTGLDGPLGIAIDSVNDYLYVTNINSGNINQINLLDGTISNISWFIEGPPLFGSTISNGNLFVSSFVGIFQFSLVPEDGIQLETQVGPIRLSTLQNCVDIHIVPFKYKQTQIYFKDVINSTHYVTHGYYLPGLQ